MAFQNILKGIVNSVVTFAIENRPLGGGEYEQVEHIFIGTKAGAVVDLQPGKGVAAMVAQVAYGESRPEIAYAWENNKFYISTGGEVTGYAQLFEYDPVLLKITQVFDLLNYLHPYSNYQQGYGGRGGFVYRTTDVATDGKLYVAGLRTRGLPSMVRIGNGTVDVFNPLSDPASEITNGINYYANGFNFTGTPSALQGVYAYYLYDDSWVHLFDTILSEAISTDVTFRPEGPLFRLHTDDRATGSATRRVLAYCNIDGVDSPGVYVERLVDLKNTADRTPDLVGGSYAAMSTLTGTTGIPTPSFLIDVAEINGSLHVGRFFYASYYLNSTSHYYGVPYALQDYPAFGISEGQMFIPLNHSWDRLSSWLNGAGLPVGTYKCNFGGLFGFSSSDEYVLFFKSHDDATTIGFLRPDNLEFEAYNPDTDPSGYVVSVVDYFQEFGCKLISGTLSTVFGQSAYVDSGFIGAYVEDSLVEVDSEFDIANLTISYFPDKNYNAIQTAKVKSLPTSSGQLAGVIELDTNQLFITGLSYTGTQVKTRSGASLSGSTVYSNPSVYNTLRFSSTIGVLMGYSNRVDIITNTPSRTIQSISNRYSYYGCKLNSNFAIIAGVSVRVANYLQNYGYVAYLNPTTFATAQLPNRPNIIDPFSGQTFRVALGLTSETYEDHDSMNAAIAYASANSLTLQQVIDMAVDTCEYKTHEPVAWDGSKCLITLEREPISGLKGIRINDEADQSGTWYDEDYHAGSEYPKAYYFNAADPTTLLESDYKIIEFQVSGFQGQDTLGRLAVSDTYVCFLAEGTPGVIRVVTKAAIESAASTGNPITSFARTITLTNNTFSYLGQYSFYGGGNRPKQVFFTVGDNLFVSVISTESSGGSKPAIYKIDLATGTATIYARLNSDSHKAIDYNPDTDTCFVSVLETLYIIDNFTGVTAPYDIT